MASLFADVLPARRPDAARLVLPAVLATAVAISVAFLLYSLPRPLTDLHGFRQSQTAMSVYWMLHGGRWLDYATPVLGAPWAVPLEVPLYQWQVALLVRATGIAIDPAGRLVSYAWLIACLPPAASLVRSYRLPDETMPFFAALLLLSPVYLFWGRAFLIETQAVALGVMLLAALRRWTERPGWGVALTASVAAAGCVATKVTTALPFFTLAALIVAAATWRPGLRVNRRIAMAAAAGLIMLPALLLFGWWTARADALKLAGPLTAHFASGTPLMLEWNFGTWEQRLGSGMAMTLIRALVDVAGWLGLLAVYLIAKAYVLTRATDRAAATVIAALVGAWLLPFLVFTNLHLIHNYYQAGNAIFLIGAVALALALLRRHMAAPVLALLLVALMASQFQRFATGFLPYLSNPYS